MLSLFFNKKKIPNFIHVTDITIQAFATENRKISVDFVVYRKGLLSNKQLDELASWLKGDDGKDSKLVLPNDTTSYYLAKVNNAVDISGSLRKGSGTIEFICQDTTRKSMFQKTKDITKDSVISYLGNSKSYPVIRFTIAKSCSELKVSIVNDKFNNFIRLAGHFNQGQVIEVDMRKKKVTVDNKLNMQILTLDSNFHYLLPGINQYSLLNGNCEVVVLWHDEFI